MYLFTSGIIGISCKRLVHVETLLFFWRKCVSTTYTLYKFCLRHKRSNAELEKLRVCFFILFWEPFHTSPFCWPLYFLKQHQCFWKSWIGGIVQLREEASRGESYQYLKVRCTKYCARIFSVVFCASTRGKWHKLKYRRFCLYTKKHYIVFLTEHWNR